MIFDKPKDVYLKYTDIIHCAFEYYRSRIKREMKNERENSNNFALVSFFERIDKALNRTKEYYISNIGSIIKAPENSNRHQNIGIFRSVLYVYDKDLDRCKELLNRHYNLYPTGEGSIKEKSEIVKDLLNKIVINPETSG